MSISRITELFEKSFNDDMSTVDVSVSDQTTPTAIVKFNQLHSGTTLASATSVGDISISVASPTGFVQGTYIVMYSNPINRYYVGSVVSVSGSDLTLDTPIDAEYPVGAIVGGAITDMSVNGSVTPQIYGLRGSDMQTPIAHVFDITRIIFSCTASSAIDLTTFANITALTNGLVLRKRDGEYYNIFNVKTNAEFAGLMYDFTIIEATNPAQGVDGFYGRLTFAGQSKIGVAIRLNPGEDLEFVVQDDLSGIASLQVVAEGHVVI